MIAIVTDSTVCVPRREADALGLSVVPNTYIVNGRAYSEGYSDENGDFERRVLALKGQGKTSQASVFAFAAAFERLRRAGYEVLCIVLSSRLSGAYSSASIAAREVEPEKIAVVDSLTTAGGLLLLAKAARSLIDKGLSLRQTEERLLELRARVGLVFSVDDMAALRKSGRLGLVPQSIGTVLNLRPILVFANGAVVARSPVRGAAGRVRALVDSIPGDAAEVIVHHMGEAAGAEPLLSAVKKRFPSQKTALYRLGPVLGVHLGSNTFGVAWMSGETAPL